MYDNKRFQQNEQEDRPKGMFVFIIVLVSIVAFLILSSVISPSTDHVTWGEFVTLVNSKPGELMDVEYHGGKGFYYSRKGDEKGKKYFVEILEGQEQDTEFNRILRASNAKTVKRSLFVTQILPNLLVVLGLLFLIYFFFFRKLGQRGDGFMSFGKSRAKLVNPEVCNVTFDDVAGIDEAVDEVKEVVSFLKSPDTFNKLGGRLPKGVLLVGTPGVGKTLLARAIAGEAGVPFFSISGSDFVELFVGVGASRVRDLFSQAKAKAPSIIFLDELDAIGRRRGAGLGGGHDEREQTLNSILVEMDGFEKQANVIVIAATNREDVLDPALLRPGRFDRQIYVDIPDINGREKILKVHSRNIIMSDKVDMRILARATPMATGADLENILNEAALIAVMDNKEEVDWVSIEKAREKVFWGKEKKRAMSEDDRRVTALHESGHAICAKILPEVDPLHKVSIIPRGRALGMTMMLPERDQYSIGRKKFLGNVVVMLAGRAAEAMFGDDITSGASDDLQKATGLVRKMVCEWGMSENIGLGTFQNARDHVFLGKELSREVMHSEKTLQLIDSEVGRIISESYTRSEQILRKNEKVLRRMVEVLLEQETLDSSEVDLIFEGKPLLVSEIAKTEDGKEKPAAEEAGSSPEQSQDKNEEKDGRTEASAE